MSSPRIQFFTSPQSRGHSYFISKDEKLFSFGKNSQGQLSLGYTKFQNLVKLLKGQYYWDQYYLRFRGTNRNKPFAVKFFFGKRIKKIVSGSSHSLIQTENGFVYSVGNNGYGQLSLGDKKHRKIATLISCFGKKKIQNFFCGFYHSVFIVENKVYSSGYNNYGQLGIGNKENQLIAKEMKINKRIINIECGYSCTFLVTSLNELYKTGIIINGDKVCLIPTLLSIFPKEEEIKKISCGYESCLILTNSKKVFGIGNNCYGNLTKKFPEYSIKPIEIKELVDIIDVKCGYTHSIVLDKNGNAYGLGYKKHLGSKNKFNSFGITLLKSDIIQIESGGYQTFLFDKFNELWVGGRNKEGDLGLGHTKNVYELLQKNKSLKGKVKMILLKEKTISISRLVLWDLIIKCMID